MAGHTHREGGPVCRFPTKKACDENYADWQHMQTVLGAYLIALRDKDVPSPWWRKGTTVNEQLIQLIAGRREAIMTKEGNPSQTPEVKRLLRAIERVKAGDLPAYNLYRLPTVADLSEEA